MSNVRIFLTLFAHEFIQNRVFLAKSQIKQHINTLAWYPNEVYKSYYLPKLYILG